MILPEHPPTWAWSHLAGAWSLLAVLYSCAFLEALFCLEPGRAYCNALLAVVCWFLEVHCLAGAGVNLEGPEA